MLSLTSLLIKNENIGLFFVILKKSALFAGKSATFCSNNYNFVWQTAKIVEKFTIFARFSNNLKKPLTTSIKWGSVILII